MRVVSASGETLISCKCPGYSRYRLRHKIITERWRMVEARRIKRAEILWKTLGSSVENSWKKWLRGWAYIRRRVLQAVRCQTGRRVRRRWYQGGLCLTLITKERSVARSHGMLARSAWLLNCGSSTHSPERVEHQRARMVKFKGKCVPIQHDGPVRRADKDWQDEAESHLLSAISVLGRRFVPSWGKTEVEMERLEDCQ